MKGRYRDSIERLLDIKIAIEEIEVFTKGVNVGDFLRDNLLASAVLFQFTVIGEAVAHVDESITDKYEYPWYKVRAFRNLISHEYFNIKLEAVWNIIEKDLPELKMMIDKMLKESGGRIL